MTNEILDPGPHRAFDIPEGPRPRLDEDHHRPIGGASTKRLRDGHSDGSRVDVAASRPGPRMRTASSASRGSGENRACVIAGRFTAVGEHRARVVALGRRCPREEDREIATPVSKSKGGVRRSSCRSRPPRRRSGSVADGRPGHGGQKRSIAANSSSRPRSRSVMAAVYRPSNRRSGRSPSQGSIRVPFSSRIGSARRSGVTVSR